MTGGYGQTKLRVGPQSVRFSSDPLMRRGFGWLSEVLLELATAQGWCRPEDSSPSHPAPALAASMAICSAEEAALAGETGTPAMILVPIPDRDSMWNLPCTKCTRSCMLTRPKPRLFLTSSTLKLHPYP